MSFNYSKVKVNSSVSNPIAGRKNEMAKNDGGGYSFTIAKMQMFERFLNLGAVNGTFYLSKEQHQYNNIDCVIECIKSNGVECVKKIAEVSSKGSAHKNDHAIYALALAFTHGDVLTKREAVNVFSSVVRIGTHLFMFVDYIKSMRGFGKSVRTAINNWYLNKSDKTLALQLTKYQQRNGWSHKDVFRLSHPNFGSEGNKSNLAKWAVGKTDLNYSNDECYNYIKGMNELKDAKTERNILKIISKYSLQREHIPTEYLNLPSVQEAMLPNMGATAILRNLGNFSKSNLVGTFSSASKFIIEKFSDRDFIKNAMLHPLTIYTAMKTYSSGRSVLGSGVWNVDNNIVSCLEEAFYMSFDLFEPTGKNFFYGIDVSGSMASPMYPNNYSYCEVAAILAMSHVRAEKFTFVGGFSSKFTPLNITRKDNLASAVKKCQDNNFGSTNLAASIEYAKSRKMDVDCFVFITDNDINSGGHPSLVFQEYKKQMGKPNTKMVTCALQSTRYTVSDPNDPTMVDVQGFDPSLGNFISNFVA